MRRKQRKPKRTREEVEEEEEEGEEEMRRRKRKNKAKSKKTKRTRERKGTEEEVEDVKPKRRRRMVSSTLQMASKTELDKLSSRQDNSFEADTEVGPPMHKLEENVLRRQQKSEVDNDEEDDEEEEEDAEKIEFDELEDPEENSDVTSTSPNRHRERTFENVETTTERVGKMKDIETPRRRDNSDSQPNIGNEEPMKAKVKVKKRNIMFRAERNEFPEFDNEEGDNKSMSGQRKKKEQDSNIPENVDENKKKPMEMKDNDISKDDLVDDGEPVETEKKLTKKKKKKMRRIRVKMNKLGTMKDENEEDEEEEEEPNEAKVQKKRKNKCKNRKIENTEGVESKSDTTENEETTEGKPKKCRGGGSKKKKKQPSRYRNVKETKKRAFVKNLRVIGRQFNVRPSASGFYGKDRDWSDRPTGRNISESPIEKFNSAWPKLKKHLFNVRLDPEERNDLVLSRPDIMEQLREKVVELLKTFVSRDYPAPSNKGRPNHFNNVWSPGWC